MFFRDMNYKKKSSLCVKEWEFNRMVDQNGNVYKCSVDSALKLIHKMNFM